MTDVAELCRDITAHASRLIEIGVELRGKANGVEWTYQGGAEHFIAKTCYLADDIRQAGECAIRQAIRASTSYEAGRMQLARTP